MFTRSQVSLVSSSPVMVITMISAPALADTALVRPGQTTRELAPMVITLTTVVTPLMISTQLLVAPQPQTAHSPQVRLLAQQVACAQSVPRLMIS